MPFGSRSRPPPDDATLRRRLAGLGAEPGRAAPDEPVEDPPTGRDDPGGDAAPGPRERQLRLDPGRSGAVLLCVVAVVAAGLSAAAVWLSRPSVEAIAPAPPAVAGSAPGTTTPTATDVEIVVAVVGQVVTPGLVTLPVGSRVADAVAAAGGALPDADLTAINLARVLTDGEQVAVGVPGATDGAGPPPAAGGPAALNLNTADATALEQLPGVGPVLAGRIVQWRKDNGPFTSVEQLREVDGIGPATFDELRDAVTV